MLLTLERSHIQLDIGIHLVKVGHGSGLVAFKVQLANDCLLHLYFDLVSPGNGWACFSRQREPLLIITLVLTLNGVNGGLPTLLLVVFDVLKRFLIEVGHWPRFDLPLDLLGSWDHLRFRLREIEGLEFSAFRLFLFFASL